MNKQQNSVTKVDLIFKEIDILDTLKNTLKLSQDHIIKELIDSGLKGRGGAGFPTGFKWALTLKQNEDIKYVVCNADEGEPGTFKDREILERVPEKVFVGMAMCAHAVGAHEGFIYLRSEYNYLKPKLKASMDEFNAKVKSLGLDFEISIRSGMGAYVCGEETSLIESMEGKRGEPRNKPPYPASCGYLGKPTVINNVETFVYATMIIKDGATDFYNMGTSDSRGAKVFSISGDTPQPGIHELEMGITIQDFVDEFGDGDTKAVQVGGASGFCVPRKMFKETTIGFEGVPTGGSMMLFNSSRSMYNVLHNFLDFFCRGILRPMHAMQSWMSAAAKRN